MPRIKAGNPKKKSRFICCKCLRDNSVGDGIQRKNQREIGHIKDMFCIYCKTETKNMEIRYCDYYPDAIEKAKEISKIYYDHEESLT